MKITDARSSIITFNQAEAIAITEIGVDVEQIAKETVAHVGRQCAIACGINTECTQSTVITSCARAACHEDSLDLTSSIIARKVSDEIGRIAL